MKDKPSIRVVTPVLRCRSLEETVDFYCNELGFEKHLLWPEDQPTFCLLDHGAARFHFFCDDMIPEPSEPTLSGQLHLDVEPGGVLALFDRLRERHEILWGPEVYSYGRREFSIRDPNGYRLVFSELTDEDPTCLES